MTAISSQYSFTGFDGYQLLIRDENDFEFSCEICFSSAVTQSNITTSSFDVNWSTNLESYSNVSYGLTPELELGEINDSDNLTSLEHTVSLENLEDGTIYYVQAFSNTEEENAYSALYAFATQSTSSGKIRLCFNNSIDTNVATIELDINNEAASYEKKYSIIGRGIGAGFQFKFFEYYTLDIIGGYHPKNINSKTKSFESEEFIENPLLEEEKLYLNFHLGIYI